MNTNYVLVKEYCTRANIEPEFILDLGNEGLLEITIVDNEHSLDISQLDLLERYIRWHYDLEVNIAGIDVIQNLLNRIEEMQSEMTRLQHIARMLDK